MEIPIFFFFFKYVVLFPLLIKIEKGALDSQMEHVCLLVEFHSVAAQFGHVLHEFLAPAIFHLEKTPDIV